MHLLRLSIHATPGARRTEAAGAHGQALRVRLAAPPVDGKANDALLGFIAERLDIARSAVSLKSGQTSRRKVVVVAANAADAAQVRRYLAAESS